MQSPFENIMTRWPGNARSERTSFGNLTRSQLMARVRSYGNRSTEAVLIKLMRGAGIKGWRRHLRVPGRPDFSWPKKRVAVFVDGCFWHGHTCGRNVNPKKNVALWKEKLLANQARDRRVTRNLRAQGWRVVRLWECWLWRRPDYCLKRLNALLSREELISGQRFESADNRSRSSAASTI